MSANVRVDARFQPSDAEKLGAEITELSAYINVAMAHFLDLIYEFDEQRFWEQLGFQSCAHWLNFHCGIGFGAGRERLRVARALAGLPTMRAEFSCGKLSFSKVRAMTRVATPENEEFLLMVAKHGTANHIERLVSQYRRVEKLNYPGGADALSNVAETYLNHPDNSGSTADRYQVVVYTSTRSAGAAVAATDTATNHSHLENGPHVSAETSKRIACDCCKTSIEEDENGERLNIGRRSRTIPPAMRRALRARDGGCRFPGCTSHKFVDGHHIKHWSDGGETSLDNLVLLCRYHHRLVHEGGFDCRKGAGGEIFFVDRRKQRLEEFQTSRSASIEESLAWMYRRFEDIAATAKGRNACHSRR